MSISENQHFVPRSYLRHFQNANQMVYASKFLSQFDRWTAPNQYNPSEICYQKDFYLLDDDKAKKLGVNRRIVEEQAFKYEKKFLPIVDQILDQPRISFSDFFYFAYLFLSLKHRNTAHRELFKPDNIKGILDKKRETLKNEYIRKNQWNQLVESTLDRLVKEYKEKDYSNSMHNETILNSIHDSNHPFRQEILNLLTYRINCLEIEKDDLYFITSDNPGFSVDIKNQTYTLKARENSFHILPISSKRAISIINPKINKGQPLSFAKITIEENDIHNINLETTKFRNEFIYCEDSTYLNRFIKKIWR